MKALTIWQPWASLLVSGQKKYETRSWATSYRGPIAIHAAMRPVRRTIDALVGGKALVGGDAWVGGNALVSGNALVYGNALVKGTRDIYWISCIGSRDGTTTFFRNANTGISVSCGCFYGTIDEFAAAVTKTHGDNEHAQAYRHAIEIAKLRIKLTDAES